MKKGDWRIYSADSEKLHLLLVTRDLCRFSSTPPPHQLCLHFVSFLHPSVEDKSVRQCVYAWKGGIWWEYWLLKQMPVCVCHLCQHGRSPDPMLFVDRTLPTEPQSLDSRCVLTHTHTHTHTLGPMPVQSNNSTIWQPFTYTQLGMDNNPSILLSPLLKEILLTKLQIFLFMTNRRHLHCTVSGSGVQKHPITMTFGCS